MKISTAVMIMLVLLILSLAVSFFAYPLLPEVVVTHWNGAGQANGFGTRLSAAYFMPIFAFGLGVLLLFLPAIDPLKRNIALFRAEYNGLPVALMVFMLYIHGVTLAYNLGWPVQINQMIIPGMGILFIYIGTILPKAKRNWLFGVRTPWTLSSDTVWAKTHSLGGKLFILTGIIVMAGLFFPGLSIYFLLAPLVVAGLLTVGYSFFLFQREQA
jgi:uncharacterized membrane protein